VWLHQQLMAAIIRYQMIASYGVVLIEMMIGSQVSHDWSGHAAAPPSYPAAAHAHAPSLAEKDQRSYPFSTISFVISFQLILVFVSLIYVMMWYGGNLSLLLLVAWLRAAVHSSSHPYIYNIWMARMSHVT
jgi:hypothetical protein